MDLVFSWWNTGLSPMKAKGRATEDQKRLAFEVVSKLLGDFNVDCLVLGEVAGEDLSEISSWGNWRKLEFFPEGYSSGIQWEFGTGLLFRRDKFKIVGSHEIISARGTRKLKIANQIDFRIPFQEENLHVFVCHWPSRMWCHENSADRHCLGIRLRDTIEILQGFEQGPAKIIVMGDFNDEPFDSSLAEQLLAGRDRSLLRKKPFWLYNPFWRLLGEAVPYVPWKNQRSHVGTYFHKSGNETKWRTFDQIIFSSSFLKGSGWQLNEKLIRIIPFQQLGVDIRLTRSDNIFDHYPVMATIQWEENNG
jgi:hypothetical protein